MGRTGFAGLRLNITQLFRFGGDKLFSAKTLTRGLIGKQIFLVAEIRIVFQSPFHEGAFPYPFGFPRPQAYS